MLLSGEESELTFVDHSTMEMTVSFSIPKPKTLNLLTLSLKFQFENCLNSYDPHGYCVIYSSADRTSFVLAERILQALWTSENIAQKAVILVGNKADLARSRVVRSDGKTFPNFSSSNTNTSFQRAKLWRLLTTVNLLKLRLASTIMLMSYWLAFCLRFD